MFLLTFSRNFLKCIRNRVKVNEICSKSFNHTSSTNPFDILGIPKNSNESTVKNAYFQLSKKYHPDRNPDKDSQEKFVRIHNAYRQILEQFDNDFDYENKEECKDETRDNYSNKSYSFTVEALDVENEAPKKFTESATFKVFSFVVTAAIIVHFLDIFGYLSLKEEIFDDKPPNEEEEEKQIKQIMKEMLMEDYQDKKKLDLIEKINSSVNIFTKHR